ncbi:unnamed protein product [Rangifer tarandus platyrhynchus]|uniref:Uncharacterized protein n=1 Tax=Rangifer tarandus platyrhynchus TaxID=3082113 RepID=A0ABN8YU85_RANTA|nr:unnamed protein product [Rangifer tarandus platyrhynchus]
MPLLCFYWLVAALAGSEVTADCAPPLGDILGLVCSEQYFLPWSKAAKRLSVLRQVTTSPTKCTEALALEAGSSVPLAIA